MEKNYTYYTDPAHGWLRVPHSHIKELGVAVTTCSYRGKKYAYLEEDCDMPSFLRAADERGWETSISEKYSERASHIRHLMSF